MNEEEYQKQYRQMNLIAKRKCKLADGFTISVQASEFHYCTPRKSDAKEYRSVEIWLFNEDEKPVTEDPQPYVPVNVVRELIEAHGGIVSGELPPMKEGE